MQLTDVLRELQGDEQWGNVAFEMDQQVAKVIGQLSIFFDGTDDNDRLLQAKQFLLNVEEPEEDVFSGEDDRRSKMRTRLYADVIKFLPNGFESHANMLIAYFITRYPVKEETA